MAERIGAAQPPDHWGEPLQQAFWTAVNAPTYEESAAATLALVQQLADGVRADAALAVDGLDDRCCQNYGLALAKWIDGRATS